ncbi:hypothetical protein M422DRAFT_264541 [Sphaerobolus stellatus SS14]|uniref:Uncharacterized protein n=1 Tax=Sphaerobolus stellatus (strain SS14) TaxID=990650 RepID=A0A0C9TT57_SPHS4|nr:hypothetical protein M422DRAFT_264541 [Sphaerobolus stellatus SS14]
MTVILVRDPDGSFMDNPDDKAGVYLVVVMLLILFSPFILAIVFLIVTLVLAILASILTIIGGILASILTIIGGIFTIMGGILFKCLKARWGRCRRPCCQISNDLEDLVIPRITSASAQDSYQGGDTIVLQPVKVPEPTVTINNANVISHPLARYETFSSTETRLPVYTPADTQSPWYLEDSNPRPPEPVYHS